MEQMRSVLPYVDLIKLSDEETELLTGYADPDAAARHLIGSGIKIAAITLGKDGVFIASKDGSEMIPGYQVDAVDTTGAGDAFWGARFGEQPGEISFSKICEIAQFANAAAACCVTKRGAIPAMPKLSEIENLQRK
jgi:fructokinase